MEPSNKELLNVVMNGPLLEAAFALAELDRRTGGKIRELLKR
ncbi:hypothetical protein [Archaeoglobus sp.]|jgi:hypothetical protein|nr:hypothetical protein [Archaeoglobus sp.]MDI3497323.1 hypothetical protein [Archaeoglobus sp.]